MIPRINLSEFSGNPGKEFRVYFYGYAPGTIRSRSGWYSLDGVDVPGDRHGHVAGNGRGTRLLTVPYGTEPGVHTCGAA